ncbi:MAG: PqqD family protein [Acidobacteriia bacterium]|nr:PqqD family protein [Terriglobia bacterium]
MTRPRYVARSTAIAARALGEETMVMSATNSMLFTLDEIASVIWESADGVTPLEQIVADKICTQYDVTLDVALQDAEALVKGLAEHGILLLSDEPLAFSGRSHKETP